MPSIEILGTGRIDERESAFPQAVQLPDGTILCSFSIGGGPNVTGGTELARSTDGGETWSAAGSVLPKDTRTGTANFLKLTLSPDGGTIFGYGARLSENIDEQFGDRHMEPILCTSTDAGRTWSAPMRVPFPVDCSLEVSHGALALRSGRLLAPGATLAARDRLGERVLASISNDGGRTWPDHSVVFEDPQHRHGYFEQKLCELPDGRLLATAWTVTLGDVADRPNHFTISHDHGETWSSPRSTGIEGQTMTPIPVGDDRLLVLYNRRYGRQGVVMCLVRFTEEAWTLEWEGLLYDPQTIRERPKDVQDGVTEFDSFKFGFPTAIPLQDGTFLATHWSVEDGRCGIRWTKLRVV